MRLQGAARLQGVVGGSSIGRPQERTAKFPRSRAPKRRGGRKPERTRAEAQRARRVLPPGETVAAQAAALMDQLLAPEALAALLAEGRDARDEGG